MAIGYFNEFHVSSPFSQQFAEYLRNYMPNSRIYKDAKHMKYQK